MFPTHVGIALIDWFPANLRIHVPYACGDCAPYREAAFGPLGCSLRMWGLRASLRRGPYPRGMFPTHVGIARG